MSGHTGVSGDHVTRCRVSSSGHDNTDHTVKHMQMSNGALLKMNFVVVFCFAFFYLEFPSGYINTRFIVKTTKVDGVYAWPSSF